MEDLEVPAFLARAKRSMRAVDPPALETPSRERWERIAVTPEIEVHVRVPHSEETDELLDSILQAARGAQSPRQTP
jgi:hypothetical protein